MWKFLAIKCPVPDPYFSTLENDTGVTNATILNHSGLGFMDWSSYGCNGTLEDGIRGFPVRFCTENQTWSIPEALYCKSKICINYKNYKKLNNHFQINFNKYEN